MNGSSCEVSAYDVKFLTIVFIHAVWLWSES